MIFTAVSLVKSSTKKNIFVAKFLWQCSFSRLPAGLYNKAWVHKSLLNELRKPPSTYCPLAAFDGTVIICGSAISTASDVIS